jgi:hypothetical protein
MENQNEEPGLRPIGSLISKIEPLPSNWDSTQTPKRPSSATTGAVSLVRRDASSIGQQHGATGAVTLPPNVANLLAGADAWSTDKALTASLPPSVKRSLTPKVNHEFDLVGYDLSPGADRDEIASALSIVEAACQPSRSSIVITEIGACFAVTTAREHDEQDITVTLKAMAVGLAEFPEDVIRDACRAYARCHKWRPSLSELREFCWPRFRARESLRATLRQAG